MKHKEATTNGTRVVWGNDYWRLAVCCNGTSMYCWQLAVPCHRSRSVTNGASTRNYFTKLYTLTDSWRSAAALLTPYGIRHKNLGQIRAAQEVKCIPEKKLHINEANMTFKCLKNLEHSRNFFFFFGGGGYPIVRQRGKGGIQLNKHTEVNA